MSYMDRVWLVMFLIFAMGLVVAHFDSRRRQRAIDELNRQYRARREEVERQARKSL